MQNLIEALGRRTSVFAERFVPDAWIYAALLTFAAGGGALIFSGAGIWDVARAWHDGLWDPAILTLIAQFSLNLVLCTAMARSPVVSAGLVRLASLPCTARGAIAWIAVISVILSQISWAFCIVGGALFAQESCRQAARKGLRVHYPLAIAAGYLGMMAWGCGLTSSAPLISSTPGHFLEPLVGLVPVSATIGSTANLVILGLLLVGCPWVLAAMHPSDGAIVRMPEPEALPPSREQERGYAQDPLSFASRAERSALLLKLVALLPLSYVFRYYFLEGRGITIDSMNLIFLSAALLFYRTPRQLLDQVERASTTVWSVVFQFPFYAGIMGIVKGTGLGISLVTGFSTIATPLTWPAIGVAFQGLLNLFVPSGGAQWIVSGDTLVRVSAELGYSSAQAILIEVMGDQLTNMVQPMWALPALALAGLQARHIMGYTAVVMILGFFIMVFGLTVFPA